MGITLQLVFVSFHQSPSIRGKMKEVLILKVSVLLVTSVVGVQESASLSRRDDDATLSSLQALVKQQAAVSQQQAVQIAQQTAKMEQQATLMQNLNFVVLKIHILCLFVSTRAKE